MASQRLKDLQYEVSELLLRHRSLLDVLSKLQQTSGAANRAIVKSVTECGCIALNAKKQPYSTELSTEQLREMQETHVSGELCEICREVISDELGKNLFYMAAVGNLLGINLDEVVEKETKKCSTLGFFNMS